MPEPLISHRAAAPLLPPVAGPDPRRIPPPVSCRSRRPHPCLLRSSVQIRSAAPQAVAPPCLLRLPVLPASPCAVALRRCSSRRQPPVPHATPASPFGCRSRLLTERLLPAAPWIESICSDPARYRHWPSKFGSMSLAVCFRHAFIVGELDSFETAVSARPVVMARSRFSNYLLQTVVEHGTDMNRYIILDRIKTDLVGLSRHQHGHYVV
ncbi:hypothetical protein ZWY2020_021464 [Hordeum vulgare]|nr:hypothetical protein ZWY2020_021464 [Hordeum vulgare]